MISVLLADDHVRTRATVREALVRQGDFEVCAEAADADGAVEAAKKQRPDVCLLDIRMPGSGIVAARDISTCLPETTVVMLTVSREDDDLFDALRAGAKGYLLKGLDGERLAEALKAVLAGEARLPGTLVARLVEEFRGREHRRARISVGSAAVLSGKEWRVLELMCDGFSTREIAERLFISQSTVRSHISIILKKLRVSDRQSAIRLLEEA